MHASSSSRQRFSRRVICTGPFQIVTYRWEGEYVTRHAAAPIPAFGQADQAMQMATHHAGKAYVACQHVGVHSKKSEQARMTYS